MSGQATLASLLDQRSTLKVPQKQQPNPQAHPSTLETTHPYPPPPLIRQFLKRQSAHRKVLDILNLLGVSNRIMAVAERRDTVDKAIVVGGMLVTLLVLWICWKMVS